MDFLAGLRHRDPQIFLEVVLAEVRRTAIATRTRSCIGETILIERRAKISVKEVLLPGMNFRWPADWFLERIYFPSLERSLIGW
jgi:hypothetical protein